MWALQQRTASMYLRDFLHQKHRSNPRWSFSYKTRFLFSPKLRRSPQIGIWLKSEMQTKSTPGALRSCTPFRISIFWASLYPAPWRSGIRVGFSTARRVAQKALHPFLLIPCFYIHVDLEVLLYFSTGSQTAGIYAIWIVCQKSTLDT